MILVQNCFLIFFFLPAEGDKVICTRCQSGFYLHMDNCASNCPNGYFSDDDTGYCLPCLPPCFDCSSEDNCTECIPDYYLNHDNGHCEASCPVGSYHRDNGICDSCSDKCLHCSGPNDCHQCDPQTFYKGNFRVFLIFLFPLYKAEEVSDCPDMGTENVGTYDPDSM